jgi:hypothetical protein
MENSKQPIGSAAAKEIDLVEYLKILCHHPQKIRHNDYWYLSPIRIEKTASFKVNRKLNRWYDHGIGKGGNTIDFGIPYHHCTVAEFLQHLAGNFSFHQPSIFLSAAMPEAIAPVIKIINRKSLHSLALIRYLHSRNIPLVIAGKYCQEIDYEMDGKMYYSIGFLNDAGGYELRNQFCKNSSSPKAITTIKNGGSEVAVFEGFFDFLSFHVLHPAEQAVNWDFCILNSLSFLEKSVAFLEQYRSIHLFLDNDSAGQNCSLSVLMRNEKYIDESWLYHNYKDLNDWIVTMGKRPQHQSRRFKL